MHDFAWRTRFIQNPEAKEEAELKSREKELKAKYEKMDEIRTNLAKAEREKEKKVRREMFTAFISRKKEFAQKYIESRKKALGFDSETARTESVEFRSVTPL